jgi:hypothetical protein
MGLYALRMAPHRVFDLVVVIAAPTTTTAIDSRQLENSLAKLETLFDILYVAGELERDPDDYGSRSRRSAAGSDDALPGGSGERLQQLSNLLRKCCKSCTAEDLLRVCPARRHSR